MNNRYTFAILLALSGLIYAGCASDPTPSVSNLDGTWVGNETGGPAGECRMTITTNHLRFQGARAEESYAGSLTLNTNTSPVQAVIKIEECGVAQYVNAISHAIFKLEGKTLTIAGNEPGVDVIPTDFQLTERTRVFVFTKQ